jgi:glycerol-3-phosphate dehydrogenase (NAD(P)+)
MKLAVFGAGAWGTALAVSAAARHDVVLWARDPSQGALMRSQRENRRYLPGIALPATLKVESGSPVAELAARCDLAIIATPMAGLRAMLECLALYERPVAWLCKGFEATGTEGLLGHEIQRQVAPGLSAGVLSGPSFALEVAQGQPAALVAASSDPKVRAALVGAFHGEMLRVYANDDMTGVEVGGAVKNVLAIAAGLCDGLQLGLNARAALITRGLAEMTRLGVALGARAETFMGLSGLGDLALTATGDLSRNRRVGLLLAKGNSVQQATGSLGHVAEGVLCARAVVARGERLGVEMPISRAVAQLLAGELQPGAAVAQLMARDPAPEVRPNNP